MENKNVILLAALCLQLGITPEDLDSIARQLAQFDAIADAKTEAQPCSN